MLVDVHSVDVAFVMIPLIRALSISVQFTWNLLVCFCLIFSGNIYYRLYGCTVAVLSMAR